jgi:7,8-dihydropterin-6-yl-methyl-4-(beta-D-ribofuranosyl)aminobenzene 5'-phosphate synthase
MLKLMVIVDNNTIIDTNYYGEPGLSFYIEDGNNKILFDLGYSDVLIRNACKMGIDINDVNMIILSHGHLDHTWGLTSLMQTMKPPTALNCWKKATLLAHPLAMSPKIDDGEQIGFIYSETVIHSHFDVILSKEPLQISDSLYYLGQIERSNSFENRKPIGTTIINGEEQADYILDDTALAYKTENGLIIISGCSHSGICNIVEHAKKVCNEDRIYDIIGGFHLLNPSEQQLKGTLDYLNQLKPEYVHACHCTDLYSRIALAQVVNIREVGVGLILEYA